MRQVTIDAVILHPTGSNPYWRDGKSPAPGNYFNPWRMGDSRVRALQQFMRYGTLPAGCSAWNDNEKKAITDRSEINWIHMRDEAASN